VIGIEREGALESRRRLGKPALIAERGAEIGIGIGVVGLETNRRLAGSDCLAQVPDQEQGVPEIGKCGGAGRVEAGGLAQQRDAFVDLAARDEDAAEIGQDIAVPGPSERGRAQSLACRAEIPQCLQRHAEAVAGRDQVGGNGERAPVGFDRAGSVAQAKQAEPAQLVRFGVIRGARLERAAQRGLGLRPALLSDAAAGEQHERGARARIAREKPGDELIGFRAGAIGQQQGREIGARIREVGPRGDHFAIAARRLVAFARGGQRIGEIESRLVALRLERERTAMASDGLVQSIEATQQVAEVHVQHGVGGHERERAAISGFGGVELAPIA
jgi:hypothetical protein